MNRPAWFSELEALAARYGAGMGIDVASLALADLWGVYRFLQAVAERAG